MWKRNFTAGEATEDNMVNAHCMLDVSGYTHALRIRNANYFSTLTMVARTGLNSDLYLQFLSCVLLHKER
jgi:hypothetical protein